MMIVNSPTDLWMLQGPAAYGVTGPVALGFDDAFGTSAITWALIFFLFLIHVVRSKWMMLMAGLIFVTIQLMGLIGLIHGTLDPFLTRPEVYKGIGIIWGIIGIVLSAFGVMYFKDWMALKKDPDAKQIIKFPDYGRLDKKSGDLFIVRMFINVFYLFLAGVLGVVAVVMCSITLQDYNIFIMVMGAVGTEGAKTVQQEVIKYIGAYLTPCFAAVLLAVIFGLSDKLRALLQKRFILVKMSFAVILLTLGAGAIITVIKM